MSNPSTPSNRRARFSGTPVRERDIGIPGSTLDTPPPSRQLQHVAEKLPLGTSLHNAHPSIILDRLLEDITRPQSQHFARYGVFVRNGGDDLVHLLHRCLRKEVWELSTRPTRPSIADLVSLGGDLNFYGRAIYLHIIEFPNGIISTRLYVGQAFNLAARIKNQHSDWRYRRDHPSLHNFAMDRSISDSYVIFATVREACDRSDLVLNLLEMWMALWIGTLPEPVIEAWLGMPDETNESVKGHFYGLNVAEPLDQGDSDASKVAFNMLKDSRDDMTKEYFWDVRKRPRPVNNRVKLQNTTGQEGAWLKYLPHALGILTIGVLVGRWTAGYRRN